MKTTKTQSSTPFLIPVCLCDPWATLFKRVCAHRSHRLTQIILGVFIFMNTPQFSFGEESNITIENDRYLVAVSPKNGVITRIRDKVGKLELIAEPRLTDNFKFSLPLRGPTAWQSTEANYILGKDQRLTSHDLADKKLVLKWAAPLTSVLKAPQDVSAMMTIELAGGEVRFAFEIENKTKLEIGEVYYPIIAGLQGLGDKAELRKSTELVLPGWLELRRANIFHTFVNYSWLGEMGAEQFHSYPDKLSMPWMELQQPALKRGVYFGAHDPVGRYKVIHLEMTPGTSGPRAQGNWPRPDELKGLPIGVQMSFVHFPYQPAGQGFEATPVVLRGHDGDWHEAARIYGEWLTSGARKDSRTSFLGDGLSKPRSGWMYTSQAFQQCGAVPFKHLSEWAKQGAAAGIKAMLLTDWRNGGHNNGIPRFDPNPKLGSREELAAAMVECHNYGVSVAAVVNVNPVTQLDEGFRRELHEYACLDRWGIPYTVPGSFEGSEQQRAYLNPGHPGMRKYLAAQMRELASLGIDGVHLQDFFARPLDFNAGTGRTADRASWDGGLECMNEILRACREVRPEFSLSTDAAWDRVLTVTQVCSVEARDGCALRTAVGGWQPTFTVTDEDSTRAIGDALRYGGRLRVAGELTRTGAGRPPRDILAYLKTVMAVREILKGTLLEGEYLGAAGFRVDESVAVTVFHNSQSGVRTAVLVNPRLETVEAQVIGFAESSSPSRPVLLWQPAEGSKAIELPARVKIPGRQVALITEEAALDRLTAVPRWQAPLREEAAVFDFASPEDTRGWTFTGNAFSVAALGPLLPRPSLNSLVAAGEPATGTATSPPFTIDPKCDRMEIIMHGGTSQKVGGEENLVIRLIDASTSKLLEEILPPSTHELRTEQVKLDKLRGKSVRLQLIDNNTASSFAWIGVRRVSLVGRSEPNGPTR